MRIMYATDLDLQGMLHCDVIAGPWVGRVGMRQYGPPALST